MNLGWFYHVFCSACRGVGVVSRLVPMCVFVVALTHFFHRLQLGLLGGLVRVVCRCGLLVGGRRCLRSLLLLLFCIGRVLGLTFFLSLVVFQPIRPLSL